MAITVSFHETTVSVRLKKALSCLFPVRSWIFLVIVSFLMVGFKRFVDGTQEKRRPIDHGCVPPFL